MIHRTATVNHLAAIVLLAACGDSPKEIPAEDGGTEGSSTGVFSGGESSAPQGALDPAAQKDLHTVVALETLPTAKYVYVRVKEGDQEYWIATILQDVAIGHSYFYRGGLLKTDFESKEYKRTFDKLFLVSQLVPAEHGSSMAGTAAAPQAPVMNDAPLPALDVQGITRIRDVVSDPKRFAGKTIQVSGTCTKVNPNIMGRNWIHVKEAGEAAKELVITTHEPVAEGQKVTVVGKVAVDKDFGAGYKYEVLLEEGRLAPPM
ncbi:MAG: hypothetical protein H6591_02820 [Flavobacteriales bacterium]|nr:hypothetical protein [Flavobacteriales bacterium]